MSTPIKISHSLYNAARITAQMEGRTTCEQIELWIRTGKCALENTDLPAVFIHELLISKNSDDSLIESFNFDDE